MTIVAVQKPLSITYSACVFVSLRHPACNTHGQYYIVICDLSGSTVLFHIILSVARFSEEKKLYST